MSKRLNNVSPAPLELKPLIEKYRTETCQDGECLKVTPQQWDEMQQTGEAICLCQKCPVAMQCLIQALIYEAGISQLYRYEIWGGTTPEERYLIDITASHSPGSDKYARNKHLIEARKQQIHLRHEKEKAQKEHEQRAKAGEQQLW